MDFALSCLRTRMNLSSFSVRLMTTARRSSWSASRASQPAAVSRSRIPVSVLGGSPISATSSLHTAAFPRVHLPHHEHLGHGEPFGLRKRRDGSENAAVDVTQKLKELYLSHIRFLRLRNVRFRNIRKHTISRKKRQAPAIQVSYLLSRARHAVTDERRAALLQGQGNLFVFGVVRQKRWPVQNLSIKGAQGGLRPAVERDLREVRGTGPALHQPPARCSVLLGGRQRHNGDTHVYPAHDEVVARAHERLPCFFPPGVVH